MIEHLKTGDLEYYWCQTCNRLLFSPKQAKLHLKARHSLEIRKLSLTTCPACKKEIVVPCEDLWFVPENKGDKLHCPHCKELMTIDPELRKIHVVRAITVAKK